MITPEDKDKLIATLTLQLQDKDKEIDKLKTTNDRLYKKNKKLENQIVESNIRFYKKGALEQLEQVRTQFRTKYSWYEETHRVCEKTDNFVIWLDNQIANLKKE